MAVHNFFALVGLLLCSFVCFIEALPEQGVWTVPMNDGNRYIAVTKSMYNNSKVSVKILCDGNTDATPPKVSVSWVLRWTPCAQEFIGVEKQKLRVEHYLKFPRDNLMVYEYKYAVFQKYSSLPTMFTCGSHEPIILKDLSNEAYDRLPAVSLPGAANTGNKTKVQSDGSPVQSSADASKLAQNNNEEANKNPKNEDQLRKKRDASPGPPAPPTAVPPTAVPQTAVPQTAVPQTDNSEPQMNQNMRNPGQTDDTIVAQTWEDGVWLFILSITPEESNFNATVTIKMKGSSGYLSAIDWPLLPFYGTMCFVYLFYGIVWMVLIGCNWRDILRIQFWVGGVIFLGMLEKAVFFAEYESINSSGLSVRGAVVFAELVSCLKRTLARMLVIIVSLGFGIVKPRLGPMLHRVLAAGFLYFVLGSIEGCLRVLRAKGDISNQELLASIPLAVLDAAICWWIFTSLVQTTRTLRLRRNLVKLSLYRHFTNTLIFTVLASVVFMIWSIKQHKMTNCITDWKEIWVDEAFWHLLFSVMLLVIMILWRPTNNNQRYAFSPLLDAAEDDDEANEPMMNDAYDGMKLRGGKTKIEYPDSPGRDTKSKAEDDLKWIEENIPASVADTALPSLLDSDEEIMTTKFEMSKME